ncbi:MAG: DUF3488 and transglutaminase-like domain-containing protein [Acidimicrobiales bacterium]
MVTTSPVEAPSGAQERLPRFLLISAEVTLVTLTVAGVLGLARLFNDASFLLPVLGFALAGHALAIGCRLTGRSGPATAAVGGGGLVIGTTLFLLPDTTWFGVPTLASFGQAARELSNALATFRDVVAPAPVEPGFILAAAIAVWVVAFVSDTAAFRAGARLEAAVPAVTLFVFGAALGASPHRVIFTAFFLAAILAYWLVQRVLAHWRIPNRMTTDTASGPRALLGTGAVLGVAAVVAAVVVGPFLPGAGASAIIPWRAGDRDGPGSRVTISPLVDIRSRLVDQADVEVFTVASPARSYWRLTSLELFDGRIWSSRGTYRGLDGLLSDAVDAERATTATAVQDFEISGLASIWLPAAYRPIGLQGIDARYDRDSASLLTEKESAGGLRYRVQSELPSLTAPELATVPNVAPVEIADAYTALPVGFSQAVRTEAARVVQGATTQYDKARRLQDHFRSGAFTYDLSVQPGHSGDDLERFLFETRRGYCEQFAGAFAAMARSTGLPARVAVGFTPGELEGDGRFHVRGLNAHAWPEVFLSGYGWVAFEPTPGRGIPGAEGYTGIPEQQASPEDPNTATTLPSPAQSVTTVAPGGEGGPTTVATDQAPADPSASASDPGAGGSTWARRLLLLVLVAVAVPALWALALNALKRRRRQLRRAAATTASDRVLVAWAEVGDALTQLGTPPRPWETPIEFAQRAAGATGVDHRLLGALAGVTTAAGYGPGVNTDVAERAADAAAEVERVLQEGLDNKARLIAAMDPRPLLPERATRLDVRSG